MRDEGQHQVNRSPFFCNTPHDTRNATRDICARSYTCARSQNLHAPEPLPEYLRVFWVRRAEIFLRLLARTDWLCRSARFCLATDAV